MVEIQLKLERGKRLLYLLTFGVGVAGYLYTAILNLLIGKDTVLFNVISLSIYCISFILWKLKVLNQQTSYGLFSYSFIVMVIIAEYKGMGTMHWGENYMRDGVFMGMFSGFTAIMVSPVHALIVGGLYILSSVGFTYLTGNTFLEQSVVLNCIIFGGFSYGVYVFFKLFNRINRRLQNLFTKVGIQHQEILKKNQEIIQHNEELKANSEMLEEGNKLLTIHRKEMVQQRDALKKANTTKELLFSVISHDLKGPVGTIKNYTDLFISKYNALDDERRLRFLTSIQELAGRSYTLLENLLKWAKAQSGHIKLKIEAVNMHSLIAEMLTIHTEKIKEKALSIETKVECETVRTDRELLLTIFRNLTANAIKFSNKNGKIVVGCIPSLKGFQVFVQDYGVGMTDTVLQNLFEVTNDKQNYGTSGEVGTGLGLMICKSFADELGGKIRVDSKEKEGARFSIDFKNM